MWIGRRLNARRGRRPADAWREGLHPSLSPVFKPRRQVAVLQATFLVARREAVQLCANSGREARVNEEGALGAA